MTRHCCVLMSPSGRCRLVHIGKALQDQQWLFESLAVQLDERRASVENTAKQVEDRSVEIPGTNKTNPLGGTLTNCFKVKSFLSPLDWKLDRSDKDGDYSAINIFLSIELLWHCRNNNGRRSI